MIGALKGGERREVLSWETWNPEKAPPSGYLDPILLADAQFNHRPICQFSHDVKGLSGR
jgi:hypothetical protein